MERDEDVRTSCCSRFALLQAQHGDELSYAGVLSEGLRVSRRLLEEDDGPMLDVLKTFHTRRIELPGRALLDVNERWLDETEHELRGAASRAAPRNPKRPAARPSPPSRRPPA
jgi:hypothetical protein